MNRKSKESACAKDGQIGGGEEETRRQEKMERQESLEKEMELRRESVYGMKEHGLAVLEGKQPLIMQLSQVLACRCLCLYKWNATVTERHDEQLLLLHVVLPSESRRVVRRGCCSHIMPSHAHHA